MNLPATRNQALYPNQYIMLPPICHRLLNNMIILVFLVWSAHLKPSYYVSNNIVGRPIGSESDLGRPETSAPDSKRQALLVRHNHKQARYEPKLSLNFIKNWSTKMPYPN